MGFATPCGCFKVCKTWTIRPVIHLDQGRPTPMMLEEIKGAVADNVTWHHCLRCPTPMTIPEAAPSSNRPPQPTTVDFTAAHNSQLTVLPIRLSQNRHTTTVVAPVLVHKPRRTNPVASVANVTAAHTISTCHSLPCSYCYISSFTLRSAVCLLHSPCPLTHHDHDHTIQAPKNSYSQTLLSSLVLLRFLLRWTTTS